MAVAGRIPWSSARVPAVVFPAGGRRGRFAGFPEASRAMPVSQSRNKADCLPLVGRGRGGKRRADSRHAPGQAARVTGRGADQPVPCRRAHPGMPFRPRLEFSGLDGDPPICETRPGRLAYSLNAAPGFRPAGPGLGRGGTDGKDRGHEQRGGLFRPAPGAIVGHWTGLCCAAPTRDSTPISQTSTRAHGGG